MIHTPHALWRPVATLALVGTFAVVGPGRAEDKPAPPAAPPAAVSPADQPITLAFKYKIGQVQNLRASAKSDLSMSPEGGGGGLGPLPISNSMVFAYSEKVMGTHQGTGTLSVNVSSMVMNTNVLGMEMAFRVTNGKVSATRNGQPVPPEQLGGAADRLKGFASGTPVQVRRDPLGHETRVTPAAGPSKSINFSDVLVLPDKPVKVGDSWERTAKIRPELPGATGGQEAPEMEVHFTYTLKEIENKKGKQLAVIETTGSTSTDPGAAGPQSNQSYTGTTHFDIDKGMIASGQYTVTVALSVPLGGLAAAFGKAGGGAGNVPASMRVDGTTEMKIADAPVTSTPAKAGKKGARKR